MKKLIILSVFVFGFIDFTFSQKEVKIPKLDINPNFLTTIGQLDSVIQYTYSSVNDSNLLHKWEYNIDENGLHQSNQYSWVEIDKNWSVRDLCEWNFDESGRLILKAHYDWLIPNWGWGGCDSEGCGKKEWIFDKNGNQIQWTQSYYSSTRKWNISEIHKNTYDHRSNMVLESKLNLDGNNKSGYKDEYSYSENDLQIGHVTYRWWGWKPFENEEYNDWYPRFKEISDFDYNGNKTMNAFYAFGDFSTGWICDYYFNNYYPSINRVEWQYNSNGGITNTTVYACDSLILKEENRYNNLGQPVYKIEVIPPDITQYLDITMIPPYIPSFQVVKIESEYDIKGNKLTEFRNTLRFSGNWSLAQKKEFAYNADNECTSEVKYKWDRDSLVWEKASMTSYSYDQEGNLTEKINLNWSVEVEDWIPESKEEWSFNKLGLISFYAVYDWFEQIEKWLGNWKEEKSYDSNGRLILESYYRWELVKGQWVGWEKNRSQEYGVSYPGKIEYAYDDAGNIILYAAYKWSDRRNTWIGYELKRGKKEWEYDSAGRLFKEIQYDWDVDLSAWIKKQRNMFDYNDLGDPLIQYQYAKEVDYEDWELILKYFYNYSPASGNRDITSSTISIFPNPTKGIINITGLIQPANVKLYSVKGQLLKSENHVESTIDVSDLPHGIYFLSLNAGDKTIRKTIVKR